jgi:hypothetical protein
VPRHNAPEVAIRCFKAHFLSVLAGVAEDGPLNLWDRLLPEITLNSSNNPMRHQRYWHMTTSVDHSITTKFCLHQWNVTHKYTIMQTHVEHGHTIRLTDGTYTHHPNTTAHMHATSNQQDTNGYPTQ